MPDEIQNDLTLRGRTDVRGPINLPPGVTIDSPTLNTPTVTGGTFNGGTFNSPTLVTPSANVISLPEQGADPAAAADTAKLYSKDVAGVTQFFVRGSDGTVHQLTPTAASSPSLELLGSGRDGALVFDGPTNVTLAADGTVIVPAAGVYTLTRDVFASSIQLDAGAVINPAGFRIFCTGTATINGAIRANGGAGGNGAAGVGGTAGAAWNGATTVYNVTRAGAAGGNAGAAGGNSTGPIVVNIGMPAGAAAAGANGGRWQGGGGGAGVSAGGTGAGGSPTLANAPGYDSLASAIAGRDLAANRLSTGSGGGGGGSSGSGGGGGGGAAGGIVFLAARTIVGNGSIEAKGGAGGSGQASGNTGGGAGGGGGVVVTAASSLAGTVTIDVSGGAGGFPNGTGQAGGNGGGGVHYQYSIGA